MDSKSVTRIVEAEPFVASLVLAFGADPFVRWLFPDATRFLSAFPALARIHGSRTATNGGAYGSSNARAAALWYPPGIRPDGDAIGAIFEEAGALERLMSVWELVAPLEPEEPHWYLRQIGVDPALQGRGLGAALMEAALAEIDRADALAYLEATSPGSRKLYARYGFSVLDEVRVGDSAPLWPMLRPRKSSRAD